MPISLVEKKLAFYINIDTGVLICEWYYMSRWLKQRKHQHVLTHRYKDNDDNISLFYFEVMKIGTKMKFKRKMKYHYHFTACKFFTSVLTSGLSLESKWQQVSTGFKSFFKYSSQS